MEPKKIKEIISLIEYDFDELKLSDFRKIIQNLIEEYGNFICHTGLIGCLINKYAPKCQIFLDDEHTKLNENFLPYRYKLINK